MKLNMRQNSKLAGNQKLTYIADSADGHFRINKDSKAQRNNNDLNTNPMRAMKHTEINLSNFESRTFDGGIFLTTSIYNSYYFCKLSCL